MTVLMRCACPPNGSRPHTGTSAQGGTHQARLERDIAVETTHRRLAALDIGDTPLAFGRIDRTDDTQFYVGRLAVDDEDRTPLVIDWRAPVAEPFYRATALEPMGVLRRRHLLTKHGREVVGLDDEVFDTEAVEAAGLTVLGEGALLSALERKRTGRMADIVATIQSEQDEAVRADLPGVLVVAGGPGTGKTAVALHRAAYLLYTFRRRLGNQGVLLVGPSTVFLRYIEQVLPSLGEHEVQLATVSGLKPRPARAAARRACGRDGQGERAHGDGPAPGAQRSGAAAARGRRHPHRRPAASTDAPRAAGACSSGVKRRRAHAQRAPSADRADAARPPRRAVPLGAAAHAPRSPGPRSTWTRRRATTRRSRPRSPEASRRRVSGSAS